MSLTSVTPQLGLVCITASKDVRYRTVTRKRLLKLSETEQEEILRNLYAENLQRLNQAIDFCRANEIKLYRLTSALFPFADTELGERVLNEFNDQLLQTGERAIAANIRLVVHPDQFVVLSSDSPEVVANSIKILKMHAMILDKLGQPRSPWAMLEIHGGKSDRSEQLVNVIRSLPEEVRSRLALENDEYAYSAEEILSVCRQADVPMVFDAHHHIIHEGLDSYDHPSVAQMQAAAQTTWPVREWQLVHISNGREAFADRNHSDLIIVMPTSYCNAPWIEVEAKLKEEAIAKLRDEWLPAKKGNSGKRERSAQRLAPKIQENRT
ncbi:MAG: UV DNA damage repair endonuclease UvsE [Coleofasciculus sp. S288]|nr:UV DNA damage repair endonuclease UvsE [Coleofasciculus sp. S288]